MVLDYRHRDAELPAGKTCQWYLATGPSPKMTRIQGRGVPDRLGNAARRT